MNNNNSLLNNTVIDIDHKKSVIVTLFGGFIALVFSIVGGLFVESWVHFSLTGTVSNPNEPQIYLLPTILTSLVSFFCLTSLLIKFSGRYAIYYVSLPLLFSCFTLFLGYEPSYPLAHNIAILFAMTTGALAAIYKNHYVVSKHH
ncbi:hypothetical protein [Sessilibacter sp. MAH4]